MGKSRICAIALCIASLLTCIPTSVRATQVEEKDIVRVGWYESAGLQEGMSDSEQKSGYSYEYLQRITDYTGWKYEYVYGEWADLLQMLEDGEIDVLAGVSYTEERAQYMMFPDYAMGTDNYYLFQHTDNPTINASDPMSFTDKTIGVVRNNRMTDYLVEWLDENEISTNLVYYDGFTERDENFANGTVDAVVGSENNIKSNSDYTVVAKVGDEPYYLAVSNKRSDIYASINVVLNTLFQLDPNYLQTMQVECYGRTISNSSLTEEESAWIHSHSTIYCGYLTDFMPFSGMDENGEAEGVVREVVEQALSLDEVAENVTVEYRPYTSADELAAALKDGSIDMCFPMLSNRSFLDSRDISITSDVMDLPFNVVYSGSYSDATFDTIAVSSQVTSEVTDAHPNSQYLKKDSSEACLDAVLSGEASCAVMLSYRVRYLLNKYSSKYGDLNTMPINVSVSYGIGVAKDSTQLRTILNKGIALAGQSVITDAIYKYIEQDKKYTFTDFVEDNLWGVSLFAILILIIIILGFVGYLHITRRSERLMADNLEKANILAALSQDYEAIQVADLDAGTITTMRSSTGMEDHDFLESVYNYEDCVRSFVTAFLVEDGQEAFLKFLDRNAMKKRLEKEKSFTYRYAIKEDASGNYVYEMTFVRVGDDPNRHLMVLGTKSIDDVLKFERKEGQYSSALLNQCAYFYEFDVDEGMVDGSYSSRGGERPLEGLSLTFPMNYDDYNQARVRFFEHQVQNPEEAEYWTCAGLRKAYDGGKRVLNIHYKSDILHRYWNSTILLSEDDFIHHLHAVYICKDVTDEVTEAMGQRRKLEQALAEAEAANKAKTMFLNNMSHDIRTPMNAILGFANLMEKEKDRPEVVTAYLKKITSAGNYLMELINNVLDMARIESGETKVDEHFMDLMADENRMFDIFDEQMREKHLKVTDEMNITHRYVYADITKVQQIAMNIVSNAVKYTPDYGCIHIQFDEVSCDREGYGTYVMKVSDTGIGMSPEFCEHVFDSFTRERNTTESKIMGTGLGMSIVKHLVDLMGGSVSVESELGKGTTFTVTFNHRIVENPEEFLTEASTKTVEISQEKLQGKRILLAEDNDLNAEIAIALLEDNGFVVDRAMDGVICVDMLNKSAAGYYDLIIMDIQMPNLDGYQATSRIRQLPDAVKAAIPIVAMTANAFDEDKQHALAVGMNAHVAKPFKVDELLRTLASFF